MATKKTTKILSYNAIFEPLSKGGYNVIVPAIPEVCTFGKTLNDAKKMAEEAILCYLESAVKDRTLLPRDVRRVPRFARLDVELEAV